MSEPVQQGSGESLGAKDLRPFLEGQVRGQRGTVMPTNINLIHQPHLPFRNQ
jgi:hypothetical protein